MSRSEKIARAASVAAAVTAAAVTVAVVGNAYAGEAATPGAAGVGDRLFPGLGNGGYDAQSYDVSFDYRPGTPKMASSMTMNALATQTLSRFNLDSVGQQIAAVNVDGKPAKFSASGEELVITPADPLRKGRAFTTTVRYTADRSQKPPGASLPPFPGWAVDNWVNTPDGFALMGQADRAHLFFPNNDHPSDKALFTFRVTVPDGHTSVANGKLTGKTSTGGRTTFVHRTAHPMATHVSQVAVGKFTIVNQKTADGLPLRSVAPTDKIAKIRPFIDRTAEQIAWFRKTLGRPFPFESYGVLALNHEYNGLALETQTLSTFSAVSAERPERESVGVQIHELAHQYFGDAVSVKTWSDMWISEGHATYYSYIYKTTPESVENGMRGLYGMDGGNRAEFFGPPAAPKRPSSVLMGTNSSGALTLYALLKTVGPEKFRQIEATFFDRYRDRSASTQDYIDTANQVSGRDLTGMLKAWLYGKTTPPMPGHPDWKTDQPTS